MQVDTHTLLPTKLSGIWTVLPLSNFTLSYLILPLLLCSHFPYQLLLPCFLNYRMLFTSITVSPSPFSPTLALVLSIRMTRIRCGM